jgi:hypothetical protein
MLKLLHFTGALSAAALAALISETTLIQQVSAVPMSEIDTSSCYMQKEDGTSVNLDRLCGRTPKGAPKGAKSTTIDLQQDANNDGIPDGLVEAVKSIELAQDKDAALKEFFNNLPYSPETRALLQQAEPLHQQLANANNDTEAQLIADQLRSLQQRMMTDPNYAKTTVGLQKMFVPADVGRSNETASHLENEESKRSFASKFYKDKSNTLIAFAGLPTGSMGDFNSGIFSKPNTVLPGKQHIAAVNWGSLRRGHVMLVRSGRLPWTQFIYTMWYTHTGNYDGTNKVYESNTDGVRLKPLSDWQQKNDYVALGFNNKRTTAQVEGSLNWAKGKYGTNGRTPYNYNFADKTTDSRLYCSQLTWKIHKNIGVDVDSNDWKYVSYVTGIWGPKGALAVRAAVAPDEVGLSGNVTLYSKAWN